MLYFVSTQREMEREKKRYTLVWFKKCEQGEFLLKLPAIFALLHSKPERSTGKTMASNPFTDQIPDMQFDP